MNRPLEAHLSSAAPPRHARAPETFLATLASGEQGLAEAEDRLRRYGPNRIERSRGESALSLLWRQVNHPIVWVLLGAAALALAAGKGTDVLVVLSAVVVNAVIGFVQEHRAGRAIEALASMAPQAATVHRDGRHASVSADRLVPGDLVPAGLRLFHVKNLRAEEAALTGESVPVEKQAAPELSGLQALFGTASLDADDWRDFSAVAATIFPVIAVEKWLWRRAGPLPHETANRLGWKRGEGGLS